ncbi:PRC-barrel domain-containing protein [Microvirga roseola]|uniref:PRC-barrel domain-containing protein n=1 Tax=Microvirga roseola TaxID=2883126 RepID=UPI001E42DDE9|nr:PRC-barrel domain-containing protein [Microvirga roseola]
MLKSEISGCLLATVLVAAPAMAQTSQPAAPADQGNMITIQPAAPSGGTMAPNMATQGSVTPMQGGSIQYVIENRPDLWRASRLEGMNVYNQNNEKVGDIREVLVNSQGQVEAVVIGVGGFLGIGERDVAVPYNALEWVQDDRMATNAVTGTAGLGERRVTGTAAGGMTGAPGVGGIIPRPEGTTTAETGAAGAGTMEQPTTTGAVGTDPRMAVTPGDQMRDYPERAVLPNATKEQLENAPQFRYAR